MNNPIESALFVYSEAGESFLEDMVNNDLGSVVTPLPIEQFRQITAAAFERARHIVIAAELEVIKEVMALAIEHDVSMGVLPLDSQKALVRCYGLPKDSKEQIALALKGEPATIDMVYCNDHLLLFKGEIGRLPLFDSRRDAGRLLVTWQALTRMFSLRLLPFTITATGKQETRTATAATGCLILESPVGSQLSKMIGHECSNRDGMISLIIVAPFSIIDYLRLLWVRLTADPNTRRLPDSIGFIRSPQIIIETESPLVVAIDGREATSTPAHLRVGKRALKLNHGLGSDRGQGVSSPDSEKMLTASLPAGKELQKARGKRIPFFTYASEQRFKDLFTALRDDARFNATYTVLMVLSTIIATVGLYLNSASVIIGAMLLAPLMAPIIAISMGLLRQDRQMFRQSFNKIIIGILLALVTSAAITIILPYQPYTGEMQGRLNPTVLDLVVAMVAGIAGAYTKSFKEILQSLAGVAIAVALVPPLAVAGIGLGRFDSSFFFHAFLLFSTNLIGIILAATFTFRVLGFSPVVRDKRSLGIVTLFLLAICIPLYLAFQGIVEQARFEKSWQHERFLVNGKYLIVDEAELHTFHGAQVLTVDILVREQLDRRDLNEFKRKVKRNLSDDLVIRAKVTYIP